MKAFQLKIMINNSKPPIWRRVIVPTGITFSQLGIIFNEVMGWSGYHLFEFEFYKKKLIFIEGAEEYSGNSWEYDYIDANTTYIREYLEESKTFTYIYDFGDKWRQKVTVEKIIDDYEFDYPQVIKYKGDCPIEDCGGIGGYYECLDIISNPDNEEYEERLEWMESQGYPKTYIMQEVNERLKEQFTYIWGKGETRTHDKIYNDIFSGNYGLKASKKDKNKNIKIYQSKKSYIKDNVELLRQILGIDNDRVSLEKYSLRTIFKDYLKEDLINILKKKHISGVSKLSKDKLLDKLIDDLLDRDVARQYFMFQTDYVINLLNETTKTKDSDILKLPMNNELEELFYTCYAGVTVNGNVSITPDAIRLYKKIAEEDFFLEKRKKSRITLECLRATTSLYGITPMDVLMKVIKKYSDITITEEEVKMIIDYIPFEFAIFKIRGNKIYKQELFEDDYGLYEAQMDKEYYIPTKKEIRELGNYGYLEDKYKDRLVLFMVNKMDINEEVAIDTCNEIQYRIMIGGDIEDVLDILDKYEVFVEDEKQVKQLFKIINDMWNNTRMIVNRGYTPNELLKYEKLQPLVKNTEGMDNVISFESAKKKVYPNSPCPCGSGKKYKFCCGRK